MFHGSWTDISRRTAIAVLGSLAVSASLADDWNEGETMKAHGTFEVQIAPLEGYAPAEAALGRMSIDKTFHGDLDATSVGEMLSAGNPAEKNAGYVAIERVEGTLHGKKGSFSLQHSGTMTPESQSLTVIVVPGSSSGELAGLSGAMSIEILDGEHRYTLEYSLP